jgi:hypothetical protein
MLVAAALCPAPPLLARELTGSDPVVPELRLACRDAVAALLAASPSVVAVVGAAGQAGDWDPGGQLDLAAFAPALGHARRPAHGAGAVSPLPAALGLGSMLLDQSAPGVGRVLCSVTAEDSAQTCSQLGERLAGLAERVALLVMGDGSARRSLRAPGYLDDRAADFDACIERAIRSADLGALLTIDATLAADLMATGRPAWQVLAGAATGTRVSSEIRYCAAPFGVSYLVASIEVHTIVTAPAVICATQPRSSAAM